MCPCSHPVPGDGGPGKTGGGPPPGGDQLRVLLPWRLQRGSTIIPGRINPGRDLQPHSNVHCLHLHLHLQTNIITHIYSECFIYVNNAITLPCLTPVVLDISPAPQQHLSCTHESERSSHQRAVLLIFQPTFWATMFVAVRRRF